jgi:hypothetical protein
MEDTARSLGQKWAFGLINGAMESLFKEARRDKGASLTSNGPEITDDIPMALVVDNGSDYKPTSPGGTDN